MDDLMRQALRRCLDIGNRPREQELCLLVMGLGTRRVHALFDSIRQMTGELAADELAKLVVLFTRLEDLQEPYRIGRGSTTAVPGLLRELSRRDAQLAKELTIWAFHTSTNSYIPFGSSRHEGLHVEALAEHEQKQAQRWAKHYAVNEQRHQERLRRVAERAQVHETERRVHASCNAERKELIAHLGELDDMERLARIAAINTHSVAAFPESWAMVSAAKQLPSETKQALCRRLQRAPKGPWRELLIALREELKPALVSSGTAAATQDQLGAGGPGQRSRPAPLHVVPESPNKAGK